MAQGPTPEIARTSAVYASDGPAGRIQVAQGGASVGNLQDLQAPVGAPPRVYPPLALILRGRAAAGRCG